MESVFDALFGYLAAGRSRPSRGRLFSPIRFERHPIPLGPWRHAVNAVVIAVAAMFLLAAAGLGWMTYRMMTDDLAWILGMLIMPVAMGGVFAAVGTVAWAIRFTRLP